MNKLVLPFLIASFVSSTAAFAAESKGKDGGGGGDLFRSTQPQLEKSVEEARKYFVRNKVFKSLLETTDWRGMSRAKNQETRKSIAELRSLIERMAIHNGSEEAALEVFRTTKISVEAECFGPDGESRDGSTGANKVGGSICVSMAMSRFEPSTVFGPMVILLAHEFSHIFGTDEDQADFVERFFTSKFQNMQLKSARNSYEKIFEILRTYTEEMHKLAGSLREGKIQKGELDRQMTFARGLLLATEIAVPIPTDNLASELSPRMYQTTRSRLQKIKDSQLNVEKAIKNGRKVEIEKALAEHVEVTSRGLSIISIYLKPGTDMRGDPDYEMNEQKRNDAIKNDKRTPEQLMHDLNTNIDFTY